MGKFPVKLGLVAVIAVEIIFVFYLLRVYDKFVSDPDNYYKNILVRQIKTESESND